MKKGQTFIFFFILVFSGLASGAFAAHAQGGNGTKELFAPLCDSIAARYDIYLGIEKLEVSRVNVRGGKIDLCFNRVLAGYPFMEEDIPELYAMARRLLPEKYRKYDIRKIITSGSEISRYTVTPINFDGNPDHSAYKAENGKDYDPNPERHSIVTREGTHINADKGLEGRHIALWQSHGYYYEQSLDRWEWQRARLMQTVEDLYTQSYVIPYLVPMLENAGAYVFLPRERDINDIEIIVDNDSPESGTRTSGNFQAEGKTRIAGKGFGNKKTYRGGENPFECGTALRITGKASWKARLPESGEYAVYVSYKTEKGSSTAARYIVKHAGGETEFTVDQSMGGGTWIYLGTFHFDRQAEVVLLAGTDGDGSSKNGGGTVTADAVKFGGGMGNIARGTQDEDGNLLTEESVSGMPRWCEGARYWLQYAGYDSTVYNLNEWKSDYMDDYMCRGHWVDRLSGGSKANPGKEGLNVPVDLAFAFHSDAGVFRNDSIIGTLAIHTLKSEDEERFPTGEDRITSRELGNSIQSQTVNDIRTLWEPEWTRRQLWDRSYYEARTPPVPMVLLESMSHQNLADMIYGLDPGFRFTVSRAVYKGILKYLAQRYGTEYAVQPLPVKNFSVMFGNGGAVLKWEPAIDEIEPTAVPDSYIVYTRIDGGAWDNGRKTCADSLFVKIEKKRIYSFKVVAANRGGLSFPSEILSIGIPSGKSEGTVAIVNGFDRIAPPAHFATADTLLGGFNSRRDYGVPYLKDICFTGEQYEFRRDIPWVDDDNPGFGASGAEYEGKTIAGNTFDYPYVHGRALMAAGYSFCSLGRDAYTQMHERISPENGFSAIDLILGKQLTTPLGRGILGTHFRCYPRPLMEALESFHGKGGCIIVSGADVGTDFNDVIYGGVTIDSTYMEEASRFAGEVLGFKWLSDCPAGGGGFYGIGKLKGMEGLYSHTLNDSVYCVEFPDGILPAEGGTTIMRYRGNNIPAATFRKGTDGKGSSAVFGFPLETVLDEKVLEKIFKTIMNEF